MTGLHDVPTRQGETPAGLGGWQTEPFILVLAGLELSGEPLVGAPTLHRERVGWQHASSPPARPGG